LRILKVNCQNFLKEGGYKKKRGPERKNQSIYKKISEKEKR